MGTIIKNSALCLNCKTILVSKHDTDFQKCMCGAIWIDGGKSRLLRGGDLAFFKDRSLTLKDGERGTVQDDTEH